MRLNFLLYPHSKYNVVHYLLQFFLITQGLTVIFLMIILTGISGVNTEGIKAKYENGVLKLTMPKKADALPETKRLEIE